MVKHISIIHRHAGETPQQFRDYWVNVHSELVKGVLPRLRKYVANFPADLGSSRAPGSGQYLACDAIVELHFDSLADLQSALQSEGWCSERRKASSARLIDLDRNNLLIADEFVVNLAAG